MLYSVGQLQANVWYHVSWVLGGSSGVQLQVKERDSGANAVSYAAGLRWRFHFWVNTYNPTYTGYTPTTWGAAA